MSEEVEAWILEITDEEYELLGENGQLVIDYSGGIIDQDPVFSIEVVDSDKIGQW